MAGFFVLYSDIFRRNWFVRYFNYQIITILLLLLLIVYFFSRQVRKESRKARKEYKVFTNELCVKQFIDHQYIEHID